MDTGIPSAAGSDSAEPAAGAPDFEKYMHALEAWLHEVIARSPFELDFSVQKAAANPDDPEAPDYIVDFSGPDADLLLEKNAALLHALEYVALRSIRLEEDHFRRIAFDSLDWRRTRLEELRLMAQVAADRAVDTGAPFALSPMNPRERRIVHLALRDRTDVRTESDGRGPDRKVVIYPTK
jgi:spoIIIJ-associated protein